MKLVNIKIKNLKPWENNGVCFFRIVSSHIDEGLFYPHLRM